MSSSSSSIKPLLDALLASYDFESHRALDPVSFVHRYDDPADREVVGLIASSLAFGNVKTILRSVARVLDEVGPHPARTIERIRRRTLERKLEGFIHRVWRGEHVAALLANAGRIRKKHGSLGAAFKQYFDATDDLRTALAKLADELRGKNPPRALAHLVPDPGKGSACKRQLLYLRWMIRPADGVDVGLWAVPPSALVIPVDTHVLRIARNLRLTERRDASWRTAEEITAALRAIAPEDPVKYDFALCHLGVSRQCPSRRDDELCDRCSLRPACRHWS